MVITDFSIPLAPPRFVIVGAGLAGLQVALDLCRLEGDAIWIAEAGGNLGFRHANWNPDEAENKDSIDDPSFFNSWQSSSPVHYGKNTGLRRRLGGRSLFWHGVLLPVEQYALNSSEWPKEVVSDLKTSFRGKASLYTRVRDDLAAYRDGALPLMVDLSAVLSEQFSMSVTPVPRAIQRHPFVSGAWRAYSALDELVSVTVDSTNVVVSLNTEVVEIGLPESSGRASLVVRNRGTGERSLVRAETIIVAAGTLESSRLFLDFQARQSSTGRERLSGLCDHLVQGFVLRVPRLSWPTGWPQATREILLMVAGDPIHRSNLFLQFGPSKDGCIIVDVWEMGEQARSFQNSLTLDRDSRSLSVRTALAPDDLALLGRQIARLTAITKMLRDAFGLVSAGRPSDFWSAAVTFEQALGAVRATAPGNCCWYTCPLGTVDHEGSCLGLGEVLTNDGAHRSEGNLFFTGPSVIPRQGAANPSLTTLALAKRLAYKLANRGLDERG